MEKNFKDYKFIDKINYVTGKKPEKCIFCHASDLLLYQTEDIVILLNRYPYNPAHLLVAPRKHIERLEDLSDADLLVLMKTVQKVIKLLRKVYSPKGFNIGLNQGKVAGASIINHLHFHVVPRYENELGFIDVTSGTRMIVENIEDTLKKLKKHVDLLKD